MATLDFQREKWRALSLRHVPALAPLDWMSRAWRDLRTHPGASLAYGVIVSVFSIALLAYPMHPYVLAALLSGFMLIAPLLAAGLVALSRAHSNGEPASFDSSLKTLHRFRWPLLRFSVFLALASALWFALAGVLLAFLFGAAAPSLGATLMGDVFRNVSTMQLAAYIVVGGLFAAAVFVVSAVTVPAIIDRQAGVRRAVATSLRSAFAADVPAMLVWSALCALLVAIGFATMMTAMVVIFPLLGHATWYAYLDLVK